MCECEYGCGPSLRLLLITLFSLLWSSQSVNYSLVFIFEFFILNSMANHDDGLRCEVVLVSSLFGSTVEHHVVFGTSFWGT